VTQVITVWRLVVLVKLVFYTVEKHLLITYDSYSNRKL